MVSAQTRFEWPDSRIDITRYAFLETCHAVVSRVADSVYARSPVLVDTLHYSQYGPTSPNPSVVIESAQRCSARFPVEQIPLAKTALAQEMYLMANHDADAATMVRRRLAAIPPNGNRERAAVLDSVINTYLSAKPSRIVTAQPLLDELIALDTLLPFDRRLGVLFTMTRRSHEAKHREWTERYGRAALRLAGTLTEEQFLSREGLGARFVILSVSRMLGHDELMDSLRTGTIAYRSMLQSFFSRVTKSRLPLNETGEGQRALPVEADIWFPASARETRYPRPGKVTLVFFVDSYRASLANSRDVIDQVNLRRLRERYPNLDIVLVAQTFGFFGPLEPQTPDKEAALLNTLFRDYQKINATLAVNTTPFFRLPAPDRRRVNESTKNQINYPQIHSPGQAYLIDAEGLVVEVLGVTGTESLDEMIGILVERQVR